MRTEKLRPLVIGKYAKPRCFKNVRSFPCDYSAHKKAWMTGSQESDEEGWTELQTRIEQPGNFENFVEVDNGLVTSGLQAIEDIIRYKGANTDSEEEEDKTLPQSVKKSEAMDAIVTLRRSLSAKTGMAKKPREGVADNFSESFHSVALDCDDEFANVSQTLKSLPERLQRPSFCNLQQRYELFAVEM
ncbi:hypothetical protein J437_LFUL017083 [Ladona fulva]|uniref:DDE-1 domain-containing protein n=1 Tax=Ladona fulva TaxID=123851 RepID=A0A8K0P7J1_LADFU|nr:hypothetical protein J437_LFUL017083 [Ladona fulva]